MKVKEDIWAPIALTVAEAARRTMVSEKTIRRAVWSGDLASYRCGRKILIKEIDLEAWIFAHPYEPTINGKARDPLGPVELPDLASPPETRKVGPASAPKRRQSANAAYAGRQSQLRRGSLSIE